MDDAVAGAGARHLVSPPGRRASSASARWVTRPAGPPVAAAQGSSAPGDAALRRALEDANCSSGTWPRRRLHGRPRGEAASKLLLFSIR
jgi:hypothetical protein